MRMASHPNRCDDLSSPDIANFGVSLYDPFLSSHLHETPLIARIQLRHHRHLRVLPAAALQAHRAPLLCRPVALLRPPWPSVHHLCLCQYPHAPRQSGGYVLLRGAERVRVFCGGVGDSAAGGAVCLFYVYVRARRPRSFFTGNVC